MHCCIVINLVCSRYFQNFCGYKSIYVLIATWSLTCKIFSISYRYPYSLIRDYKVFSNGSVSIDIFSKLCLALLARLVHGCVHRHSYASLSTIILLKIVIVISSLIFFTKITSLDYVKPFASEKGSPYSDMQRPCLTLNEHASNSDEYFDLIKAL
jgi:hypothetical protein